MCVFNFYFSMIYSEKNGVNWQFSVLNWFLVELTVYGIDVIRNDPARPRPELMPSTDRYHGACTMHINGFGWPKAQPGSVVQPILLPYGKTNLDFFLKSRRLKKKRLCLAFHLPKTAKVKDPSTVKNWSIGAIFLRYEIAVWVPWRSWGRWMSFRGSKEWHWSCCLRKPWGPLWRDHLSFCPLRGEYLNRKCGLKKLCCFFVGKTARFVECYRLPVHLRVWNRWLWQKKPGDSWNFLCTKWLLMTDRGLLPQQSAMWNIIKEDRCCYSR